MFCDFEFFRFQEEAPVHERQRLKDNRELLLCRIDTLKCHKKKLNEEIRKTSGRLRHLECELNSIKPDFLYLYRRRERLTKMLQNKGLSSMTVQNLLQNFFNADDYFKGSALVSNGSPNFADGAATHTFSPTDSSSLIITGCSKQDCVNLLTGKSDGTFLVRSSESRSGFYALSVVCGGKIHNCLIECKDDKYGFAGTDAWFPSLYEFVSYYSSHSLKDHNSDLDIQLLYPVMPLASKLP
ncbi:unnamed protein product [Soboliphyme baturini]|uniref:SH2 domain-containing protein n=1 Tax=Soboliphyme baturini TaxID=241478 RepID=A0A3P8GKS4_9BILA|nr:unnamed protein product [Soboliphyme baturini]